MRKILFFVIGFVLISKPLFAGGWGVTKVDGSDVTQPISAASLPLPSGAATSALQSIGVSDTLYQDSMVVNNSSGAETTKALTDIKSLRLKATTGIDVRVAIGTGGSTATTYEVVFAGETFILKDLNAVDVTVAILGNGASDDGILSVFYSK